MSVYRTIGPLVFSRSGNSQEILQTVGEIGNCLQMSELSGNFENARFKSSY